MMIMLNHLMQVQVAVAAEEFVKELQHLNEKESYSPKPVVSIDETAVSGKGCILGFTCLKRKIFPQI
jgi:enoyl-CoA hydratase/carnithine racemase